MPEATHTSSEIDCPYFDATWAVDHPEWPPDDRVAQTFDDTKEH